MILFISLLLLTGCGRAGESEFYICDVAKRVRKRAEGLQTNGHEQIFNVATMCP